MVPLNLSLSIDQRLWREDIRGSVAWARALGGDGMLTPAEVDAIVEGLGAVSARIVREGFVGVPD